MRPHGLERPAAPILADEVEALAATAPAAERSRPADLALRLVLAPVSVGALVVGSTAAALRSSSETAELA